MCPSEWQVRSRVSCTSEHVCMDTSLWDNVGFMPPTVAQWHWDFVRYLLCVRPGFKCISSGDTKNNRHATPWEKPKIWCDRRTTADEISRELCLAVSLISEVQELSVVVRLWGSDLEYKELMVELNHSSRGSYGAIRGAKSSPQWPPQSLESRKALTMTFMTIMNLVLQMASSACTEILWLLYSGFRQCLIFS